MFNRIQRWFGNGWVGLAELFVTLFCVFFSLSIHEFAHGFAAHKLGDDTAKNMGRLNLSPLSHLDPIGAICLFLFGFGWARPVPVNPGNFAPDKRKAGMVWTSVAGPFANVVTAFVALFLLRLMASFQPLNMPDALETVYLIIATLLSVLISMNIGLAVFNFMPIPPLDGSKILNAVLPPRIYFKIMQYEQYGFIILIILLNTSLFSNLLVTIQSFILMFFSWILDFIPFLA